MQSSVTPGFGMNAVRLLFRLISYLFSLFTGVLLFGIGFIGWATGEELHFELVPGVEPASMGVALMGFGAFALLSLILTVRGGALAWRMLFGWNFLVFALLLCALTRPSYRFEGMEHLQQGAVLFVVSLAALAGSWSGMRSAGAKGKSPFP